MNAKVKIEGQSSELLGLTVVLAGSLPGTLMTEDAPDRYTVEAVFSRKVDREEAAAIHGELMRAFLSSRGYPSVELRVADRRLEIANTNLEELCDGLAAALAERVASISAAILARREMAARRFQDASQREQVRVASVQELADAVSFTWEVAVPIVDDDQRIEDWVEEGGADR